MSSNEPIAVVNAWGDAFDAKDLDAMMELFESEAIWVSPEGEIVKGTDGIRGVFADFLALDATFKTDEPKVHNMGDIALVHFTWVVKGKNPAGEDVEMTGRTADVLRKQGDGSWKYVIDDPFGGGAV